MPEIKTDKLLAELNSLWHMVARQGFYGRKNFSPSDNSYTATLWYVIFYLPVFPVDTYRVTGIDTFFRPKLFRLDEYYGFDAKKIEFDMTQALILFLLTWVPIFFTLMLLFVYPLIGIATLGLLGAVIAYQSFRTKRSTVKKHGTSISELKNIVEHQKAEPISEVKPQVSQPTALHSEIKPTVPPTIAKNAPVQHSEIKLSPGSHAVPHLWDDLFKIKPPPKHLEVHGSNFSWNFIIFLGFLDFSVTIIYSLLIVFLNTNPAPNDFIDLLRRVLAYVGDGVIFSIVSAIIGVLVSNKSKVFGFFLILLSIGVYFVTSIIR